MSFKFPDKLVFSHVHKRELHGLTSERAKHIEERVGYIAGLLEKAGDGKIPSGQFSGGLSVDLLYEFLRKHEKAPHLSISYPSRAESCLLRDHNALHIACMEEEMPKLFDAFAKEGFGFYSRIVMMEVFPKIIKADTYERLNRPEQAFAKDKKGNYIYRNIRFLKKPISAIDDYIDVYIHNWGVKSKYIPDDVTDLRDDIIQVFRDNNGKFSDEKSWLSRRAEIPAKEVLVISHERDGICLPRDCFIGVQYIIKLNGKQQKIRVVHPIYSLLVKKAHYQRHLEKNKRADIIDEMDIKTLDSIIESLGLTEKASSLMKPVS